MIKNKKTSTLNIASATSHYPLYGLILSGGQSKRMGKDKVFLKNRGTTHIAYLLKIMAAVCQTVYVSCRSERESQFENPLVDVFMNMGPMSGILSGFRQHPNVAWLTIASDQYLLDENTLQILVGNRDHNKLATCFFNSETQAPEPLLTIWEPKAYLFLLKQLAKNQVCPRRCLIRYHSRVRLLYLSDESPLKNANTPETYKKLVNTQRANVTQKLSDKKIS